MYYTELNAKAFFYLIKRQQLGR